MSNEDTSPDFEGGAGSSLTVDKPVITPETPIKVSPGKRGGTFQALRYRNFRLFWTGALVSNLGNWMQTVGQNWLVLSLTGSPFMLGLVNFFANLPMLLLSLFGGVVADRNSRKQVLLITQNMMAVLVLLMALLSFFQVINVWLVLAIALAIGVVQAFNSPAYQTIMLDLVGKEDLMNAIALNSLQFNLTRIIGPSIAGVVVSVVGVAACFFFNSLSFMAVVAALLMVRLPAVTPAVVKRSALVEIKESFLFLRHHRELSALLGIASAFSIFIFPYLTLLPVFAKNVYKSGAGDYGLLLSAVGVGALCGAIFVANASNRIARLARLMTIGMVVMVIGLTGFALSPAFVVSLVILAGCGGAMVVANTTLNTMVQSNIPGELRGRILSIWTLCSMGLMPVGNLQSGLVAEALGAPFAIILNALLFSLATALILVFVPRIYEL